MTVSAEQVTALLDLLQTAGLDAQVDGGWGVDALLGRQTREHDDLDLVLDRADLREAQALLAAHGFSVERDLLPTALALRHPDGRGVDLHPVEPTEDGGGHQLLEDGSRWRYGPPVQGLIGEREVRCVSVETQVRAHLGYEPDADDRADMAALAMRFGVVLPQPYSG